MFYSNIVQLHQTIMAAHLDLTVLIPNYSDIFSVQVNEEQFLKSSTVMKL